MNNAPLNAPLIRGGLIRNNLQSWTRISSSALLDISRDNNLWHRKK